MQDLIVIIAVLIDDLFDTLLIGYHHVLGISDIECAQSCEGLVMTQEKRLAAPHRTHEDIDDFARYFAIV